MKFIVLQQLTISLTDWDIWDMTSRRLSLYTVPGLTLPTFLLAHSVAQSLYDI